MNPLLVLVCLFKSMKILVIGKFKGDRAFNLFIALEGT